MKKLFFICQLFLLTFVFCDNKTNTIVPDTNNHLVIQDDSEMINENLPETNFKKTFVRMMVTLVVIIILVLITFFLFKRLVRNRISQNNSRSIKIIEKKTLSPKSMLYLLQIDNKKVLLCESHMQVRKLLIPDEIPANVEEEKNN